MNITFKLGNPNKSNDYQVYMRIVFVENGAKREKKVPMGIYLKKNQWNGNKVVRHNYSTEYNYKISDWTRKLEGFKMDLLREGTSITMDLLMSFLKGKQYNKIFNEYYRKSLYADKSLQNSSLKDQQQSLNIINDFNDHILFSQINHKFIKDWNNYLLARFNSPWTIRKHHKNFKKFLRAAKLEGLFYQEESKWPYNNIVMPKTKRTRDFLLPAEIKKLEDMQKDFKNGTLLSLRYFLLACYTGLAIVDTHKIEEKLVNMDNRILSMTRTKTGVGVALPLNSIFDGKPWNLLEQYNFKMPYRTDQTINKDLKFIAIHAEIDKNLSMHVGRHSFLTIVALLTGNVFKVMKLGGIKKVETAQHYIHLAEELVNDGLEDLDWGV